MSITITRAGIYDTIQDGGRFGYRHLGIGPGGGLDPVSAQLANALLGKSLSDPVIECHVPAASMRVNEPTILVITGAGQAPHGNGTPLPLNQPVLIPAGFDITWRGDVRGRCTCIAVLNGLHADCWLGSRGTDTRVGAGGFGGRPLRANDTIPFTSQLPVLARFPSLHILPWKANLDPTADEPMIQFMPGREWHWLTEGSQASFETGSFRIENRSDRMGFRLEGPVLEQKEHGQMVSGPVTAGTIQLLPTGQVIVLMADHQTTGGYPRIGHVISPGLHHLAQQVAGKAVTFQQTDLAAAEIMAARQSQYLGQLKNACTFKIQNFLDNAL
jgi:antagonist of KipI